MKLLAAVLGIALLVGCSKPVVSPDVVQHTRKVWMSEDTLYYLFTYQGRDYGCGHIERSNNGWVYHADVNNWHFDRNATIVTPESEWNSFSDAERFVEQWCKP